MIKNILLATLGGAAGSALRYIVSRYVTGSFPYGTFTVNVAGCLLIGLLTGLFSGGALSPAMRLLLITGFCGGFTTFSTFANESIAMMRTGDMLLASLYIGGSVAVGISATYLGLKAAEWFQ